MSEGFSGQRILVTGATGQVALPVVEALAGDNEVFAMARFSQPGSRERLAQCGAETVTVDLCGDLSAVPGGLDYVFNFAVLKSGDFGRDLEANAQGAGRLLQHCAAGLKAFVHFSTTGVYQYEGHAPRRIDSPLGDNHRSLLPTYSISKIAAENVVRFAARAFEVPTTIVRLNVPYGNNGGWPYLHLLTMSQGKPVDVHRERPNEYNLLHERDCIAKLPALARIAEVDARLLNFGGSQRVSVEEWCAYLGSLTGLEPEFRDSPGAFGSLSVDTDEMHALIGPTEVDWKDGLREMVQALAPEMLRSGTGETA